MGKNVLILLGSPRKEGNSHLLAKAFAEGTESAGHTVTYFDAGKGGIAGCMACGGCWKTGAPCVQKDRMQEAYPLLEQADVLVITSPLYFFDLNAQVRAVLDRFYPYGRQERTSSLHIQESVLLMTAAGVPYKFDGARATYELMVEYMKWTDRGMILADGVWDKGDIKTTGFLDQAKALGAAL